MNSEDEVKRRLELLELRVGRQERRIGLLLAVLALILVMCFLLAVAYVPYLLISPNVLLTVVGLGGVLILPILFFSFHLTARRYERKRGIETHQN